MIRKDANRNGLKRVPLVLVGVRVTEPVNLVDQQRTCPIRQCEREKVRGTGDEAAALTRH